MTTSQQVLTLSCQEQTNEYLTTHHLRFTSLPPSFHSSLPFSLPASLCQHACSVYSLPQAASVEYPPAVPITSSSCDRNKKVSSTSCLCVAEGAGSFCAQAGEDDFQTMRSVFNADTSNLTLLIDSPASSRLFHTVSIWPVRRSLILRLQTPLHTYIFHYPSLFSCCHLHSILAKTLLFKFTLLCTSLTLSCFPSEPKPSQRSPRNGQPPPVFPFI